jgi:hypothetical protein
MRSVLSLLFLLLLTVSAHAIVIEDGFLAARTADDLAPKFLLEGQGFTLAGSGLRNDLPIAAQNGVGPGGLVDLSHTVILSPYPGTIVEALAPFPGTTEFRRSPGPIVVFNGETTLGATGTLTFAVTPFDQLKDDGLFTMTGSLTFAGQTVTLDGGGVASIQERRNPDGTVQLLDGHPVPAGFRFDFEPVSEPTTLVLIGGAAGLAGLSRLRRGGARQS